MGLMLALPHAPRVAAARQGADPRLLAIALGIPPIAGTVDQGTSMYQRATATRRQAALGTRVAAGRQPTLIAGSFAEAER